MFYRTTAIAAAALSIASLATISLAAAADLPVKAKAVKPQGNRVKGSVTKA
jgi:hypothetical protein